MTNELLFFLQTITIASSTLAALKLGKEALVALTCLLAVLSNIFVLKQITLFGLHATAADAFAVGALLSLNLLQEYFGNTEAKKAIWTCFFSILLYTVVSQIHLLFVPSFWDTSQCSFVGLMHIAPRLAIASLISYFLVQQIDRFVYASLQRKLGTKFLLTRNYCTLALSQLLDTILFAFLGLYGIVHNVFHIIIIAYIIKLAAIAVATPFVALSKNLVRNYTKPGC